MQEDGPNISHEQELLAEIQSLRKINLSLLRQQEASHELFARHGMLLEQCIQTLRAIDGRFGKRRLWDQVSKGVLVGLIVWSILAAMVGPVLVGCFSAALFSV